MLTQKIAESAPANQGSCLCNFLGPQFFKYVLIRNELYILTDLAKIWTLGSSINQVDCGHVWDWGGGSAKITKIKNYEVQHRSLTKNSYSLLIRNIKSKKSIEETIKN